MNAALHSGSGPAYIRGNVLHISAKDILSIPDIPSTISSDSFTVTEPNIKKSATVRVSFSKPSYDKDGLMTFSGWSVGTENVDFSTLESTPIISSTIELLHLSGRLAVGLHQNLEYVTKRPSEYTTDTAYVMITGPNSKAVQEATGSNGVGVYVDDTNNCIRLNVAGEGSGGVEFLPSGTYKVKIYIATWNENQQKVTTTSKDASFTVGTRKNTISFQKLKDSRTSTYVASEDDLSGIAEIIEELFVFRKDGVNWVATSDLVESADVSWREKYVVIRSVTLRIPLGNTGYSYLETIKGLNKSIYHGVYEY